MKKPTASRRRDPLAGFYLTMPVFAIYHVGVIHLDSMNGADLLTRALLRLLENSAVAYTAVVLSFALVFGLAAFLLRRRRHGPTRAWKSLLAESAVLAVVLPLVAALVTSGILGPADRALSVSPLVGIVHSAGAGFHEELLFRVGLFGGLTWLLTRRDRSPTVAIALAAIVSSVLFSLAHHIGPAGEPMHHAPLIFRTVAGLLLCAIYRLRGFAVAVYAHALYDVYVMVLL